MHHAGHRHVVDVAPATPHQPGVLESRYALTDCELTHQQTRSCWEDCGAMLAYRYLRFTMRQFLQDLGHRDPTPRCSRDRHEASRLAGTTDAIARTRDMHVIPAPFIRDNPRPTFAGAAPVFLSAMWLGALVLRQSGDGPPIVRVPPRHLRLKS